MKRTKLLAIILAFTTSIPFATVHVAAADNEETLTPYLQILDEFNNEYGTSYKLATSDQLCIIGESTDEMNDFFNSMTDSEFYDYLYEAYLLDASDEIEYEQVDADDIFSVDNSETYADYTDVIFSSQVAHTGTQHYYYSGSATKSLYINATWSYGDGYYRYNQTLNGIGETHADGNYPYYAPYNTSYYLANSSREMACTFYCTRYVSKYVTQGNYTIPVNFVAGGGDIWNSMTI